VAVNGKRLEEPYLPSGSRTSRMALAMNNNLDANRANTLLWVITHEFGG
jgi:hypothetical protein